MQKSKVIAFICLIAFFMGFMAPLVAKAEEDTTMPYFDDMPCSYIVVLHKKGGALWNIYGSDKPFYHKGNEHISNYSSNNMIWWQWNGIDNVWMYKQEDIKGTDSLLNGSKIFFSNHDILNTDETIYFAKNYESTPPVLEFDATKKLTEIDTNGFIYNNIFYPWNSQIKDYMTEKNLNDYLVFYDDYNRQLVFIWAFDDILAQANYELVSFQYYYYYFDIITASNNKSVLPFGVTRYQIDSQGYLTCIDELKTETEEKNIRLKLGWMNTDFKPPRNDYANFYTYQEYVLNHNLVASNCYIYDDSGVFIKGTVEINNDNIALDQNLPQGIDALKYELYSRLPIIGTTEVFIDKFKNVLTKMEDTNEPPKIIMQVNDFYGYTGELNVLDISWYEPYRDYVKAILSALLIIPFILWLYRKGLPEAIGGI